MHPKHPKKEVNDALDYADQQGLKSNEPQLATNGAGSGAAAEPSSRSGRRRRALTITAVKCAGGLTSTSTMSRGGAL